MDWTILATTIGAALLYTLSGYLKDVGETWDWLKFTRTMIIGVGVGIVVAVYGGDVETVYAAFIGFGAVPLIDNFLKAIWRRLTK
jgi:hypothetical protein